MRYQAVIAAIGIVVATVMAVPVPGKRFSSPQQPQTILTTSKSQTPPLGRGIWTSELLKCTGGWVFLPTRLMTPRKWNKISGDGSC